MDLSGDASKLASQSSYSYSLQNIKRFLSSAYSDVKFPADNNNPLKAIAFSGSIIFKKLSDGSDDNIIKSIQNDIKVISKISPLYKSIIYISNDHNFLDPVNKMGIISKVRSGFAVDIIPYSFFENSSQPFLDSPDLINKSLVRGYSSYLTKYENVTPILIKIFNYVYTLPVDQYPPQEPEDNQLLQLDEKIKANFWDALEKDVHNDVLSLWQTKMIIETFIKKSYNHYRLQFDKLKSKVIISYLKEGRQFSDDEVNDILIFNSIAESIIPPELKNKDEALGCAKALVYYFFEYCLFGRKTKYDSSEFRFDDVI